MDELREQFKQIEILRFNIMNNYVMGIVKIEEIDMFRDILFTFRDILYEYETTEDTLLEIAKMKSMIQHYNTEVLEDEDVLKIAYDNSN